MASFLSALANIGSQYAQGRTEGLEEKQKLAQEKAQTEIAQNRLGLEKTQQETAQQRLEFEKSQLEFQKQLQAQRLKDAQAQPPYIPIDIGKGRKLLWDSKQQKLVDPATVAPDPTVQGMKSVQAWINTQPKEDQPKLMQDAVSFAGVGADPQSILTRVQAMEAGFQKERFKQPPSTPVTPETIDELVRGMPPEIATRFRTRVNAELAAGAKNPSEVIDKALNKADTEAAAWNKAHGPQTKGELTAAASKIVATTLPTMQQVDRLVGDIDRLGLQTNNQRGYLFLPRLNYMFGKASPQGTLASDIAGFSLGSVIEAGSALQGTTRSISALRLAMVHTPNPWVDSPMMMRQKLVEIHQRLQDMVNDAQKYGTKRGMAVGDTSAADIPVPITSGATDVPTAPQTTGGGGLSPAAQGVLDSYQKKQPSGRQ